MWFGMCEAPLDDWANGGSVDVFFTYGEYGFSSWGFKDKIMMHCFREVTCQQSYTPEILILGVNCLTIYTVNV